MGICFQVPEEVIEELRGGERQPLIVEGQPKANGSIWEFDTTQVIRTLFQTKNDDDTLDVKNDKEPYNIYKADHDVENCYGWCVTVTKKQLDVLKDSLFGVVMVNLTKGVMMGPHWNPSTAEVAIVVHGQAMIQVVCPSLEKETMCQNSKFKVEEGDVFLVPKYHPMTQISFNNDSFVFMGFTSNLEKNNPQYLAGQSSIFKMLDKWVLAKSFDVSNMTIDRVLLAQRKSIILECTSCAESMEEETTGGEGETTGGGGEGGGGRGWEGEPSRKEEMEKEGESGKREEEEIGWEGETTGGGGGGGGGELSRTEEMEREGESGEREEEEMGWEGEMAGNKEEEMRRREREAEAEAAARGGGGGMQRR
ncbi:Cupin 1 [Cynara cardunculus var. scolymus]|uniref:Cupin 1 n=1 Tax=Cynara cardunculus var. scolymus TaxID=59895 RepID=A0A103YGU0_CYNCS|nr:Cupin 1 [Cynara cardunculus var. scolymus]